MSLLRALRAYIGLGPDEDYDDLYLGDPDDEFELGDDDDGGRMADGRSAQRRVGYLDDLDRPGESTHRRSSGASSNRRRGAQARANSEGAIDLRSPEANRSRNRRSAGEGDGRGDGLSETDLLLNELVADVDYVPDDNDRDTGSEGGRIGNADDQQIPDDSEGAVVRSIDSARSRPKTLIPESFADAKLVADEFRRGTPVVINLQGQDRELVRRLVDFASGICYALDGSMEKLAPQVFLLIPEGRQVSEQDRRRIEQRGYAR